MPSGASKGDADHCQTVSSDAERLTAFVCSALQTLSRITIDNCGSSQCSGGANINAITGTWQHGQVLLDEPDDWPDGTTVVVEPAAPEVSAGMLEQDWPSTPEEIAKHLARMVQIRPLEMTPEEEAAWHAARRDQKDPRCCEIGAAGSAH